MKRPVIAFCLLFIAVGIGAFWFFQSPAQPPDAAGNAGADQETSLVSDYIRANISTLSPTPAVLGGTFYVTEITFPAPNVAIVHYEDGHIALTAEAHYVVAEGRVTVRSFALR